MAKRIPRSKLKLSVRYAAALAVLVGIFAVQLKAQSTDGPKQWLTNYAQARAASQRYGLPMIVHFSTTWCGPCQQMERETFNSNSMLQLLGSKYIGVKIDAEAEAKLASDFKVTAYPTDIIVAPDGQIVHRNIGYQDQNSYLAQLKKWENRFERDRSIAIAKLTPKKTPVVAKPDLQANPIQNQQTQIAATTNPQQPPIQYYPELRRQEIIIGLDGYSPVRIKNNREWIKGRQEYAAVYQGVTYYLADDNEHRLFNSNPERYSPKLLGCDPVELFHTDRAVPGRIEIGAFYDGDLFLFANTESRNQFKLAPERFTKTRHVLKAEDIGATRFR